MPAEAGPLLAELRREAEGMIATRAAEARAEAARIRDAAGAQRERRRAAAVGEREQLLAQRREAARAAVVQSTLHDVLTAREAFVTRAFAEAERQLDALAASPDLSARLAPLVAQALAFLDADDLRVRCAPPVRAAVQGALAAAGCAGASIEPDATVATGALLENAAGTVRVDATLAARLRRMRPTLAIAAVRQLEEATP